MDRKKLFRIPVAVLGVLLLMMPIAQAAETAGPSLAKTALRTIYCDSTITLQQALLNAQPGDKIIIKAGTYIGNQGSSGDGDAFFFSGKDGTAALPIIVESEDPLNPAVLSGSTTEISYVLYLTGDYWEIKNLKVKTGRQGIVLDHSNHSLVYGCEIFEIGQEGIHLRDGSSQNKIENCLVRDTGKKVTGFGEGIYVGSDFGKWSRYSSDCNDNIITGCTIGPNVTAEHIDIKEGTLGTIVENCTFNGTGIVGDHFSDSFIDVKGNKCIIRNNTGYRNQNEKIADAFQVHEQMLGQGIDNQFLNNTLYLDNTNPYVVNVGGGSATASNNKRIPDGNLYNGNVKTTDKITFALKAPDLIPGEVLFRDDFEDGDYNGWTVHSGSWSVEVDGSKVIKQSNIMADYFVSTGSPEWTNYAVEARIKPLFMEGGNTPSSLMARFQDPNNFYYVRLSGAGMLEIRKKQGNTKTLALKPFSIVAGTWYTVKLEVYENWIICYINGKQELVAQDSTFRSGKIALNCYKSNGEFDDVIVRSLHK